MMDKSSDVSSSLDFINESNLATGILPDHDIMLAMYRQDIFIYPFCKSNLTPTGYNFCPSEIIISTKSGLPLKVVNKGNEKFVFIPANDTVLITTKEYLRVSDRIIGTFHSRVRTVSQGFGHISTTLDPCWTGPLLIALNNPMAHKIKLTIESGGKAVPFTTLIFYHSQNPSVIKHDNPPNRIDVLRDYLASPSKIKQILLMKRYAKYKELISRLEVNNEFPDNSDNCISYYNEMQGFIVDAMTIYKKSDNDSVLRIRLNNLLGKYEDGNANRISYDMLFQIKEYQNQYYMSSGTGEAAKYEEFCKKLINAY